jgi:signal transduction histidine kinase
VKRVTRSIGIRIERQLQKLGPVWSTVALSCCAVTAAILVHLFLRIVIQGQMPTLSSVFNVLVEAAAVATPMILYSRSVIRALDKSRAELKIMSQRQSATAMEAIEGSRAKSAFLANMSHELRTPLNAILGFSEIMKDQHLGPVTNARYLAYAADIHSSGRHLLGIINDVLDLAKIESGKMNLDDAEEFEVAPALQSALVMLTGLGERQGVTVEAAWNDPDIRLLAVPRMLRQIVINLVGNAIKFTPAGGRVTLSGNPSPDGGYHLCVCDTGIGMNQKEVAVALIPFGQNHNKMAGRREGTGLGLPLAKAMMELHGGALVVESVPNLGTTVTLAFPASRVVRAEGQQAA